MSQGGLVVSSGGGGGSVNSVSGTASRISSTGGANPIIDIDAAYVGQASITTLGTVTTGVWDATAITAAKGGTGATTLTGVLTGNGTGVITGAAVTQYGVLIGDASNAVTSTAVGSAGQVLTSNGAGMNPTFQAAAGGGVTSVSGTASRVSSTGGTTPVIDIDAAYVGQASITTLGTVTTGTWNGTTVAVANGGTGNTSFTAGSVPFSNGSIITQDNSNLFWDDTNNRLGIGTTTPLDELHVVGGMDLVHTAAGPDDHALEIDCDAAGFGDVKAIDINYVTGAMTSVQDEECILLNIDESASTGGIVNGYEVLSTAEGSATINGYTTGINVNPIVHQSGTFSDADSILNKAVDVTAALASGGAGNISIFVADNDTLTIGDAAIWDEHEIILATGASGAGVAPTFEYSTGGAAFSVFTPADGTNGFRNTGSILWDSASLTGWATATSGLYEVRITRTRNSLSTTPIIDELRISSTTEYKWDKSGAVSVASLSLTTALPVASGGTGLSTVGGIPGGQLITGFDSEVKWFDPRKHVMLYDDFISGNEAGLYNWKQVLTGGNVRSNQTGQQLSTNPGIFLVDSTSAGVCYFGLSESSNFGGTVCGGGRFYMHWIVKISALSDGTDTFSLKIGMLDTQTLTQDDGLFFEYTHSVNSGNWQICSVDAATKTTTNTSTAVGTGWVVLGIECNAAGTSVKYTVDGVEVANSPITTNIPTTTPCSPAVMLSRTAGTSSRILLWDQMYYFQELTTSR